MKPERAWMLTRQISMTMASSILPLLGSYWGNIDNFLWIRRSGSWSSGFSLPNDRNRGQTG